jgi:NAD(P)-dependent dehydrogenase (short-subunit alcohol dehydrogenase family)
MDLAAAGDADYAAMAQAIGYQIGHLDGILHCAAAFETLAPQALESVEGWLKLFKVNAAAPAAINRACANYPGSQRPRFGDSGRRNARPYAGRLLGRFAVSKAALEAYFKVQADEWADTPMRINLLIPGPINSPQRAKTHPGEGKTACRNSKRCCPQSALPDGAGKCRTFAGRILMRSPRGCADWRSCVQAYFGAAIGAIFLLQIRL